MNDDLAIGVDLGATKIAIALITRGGEVLASRQTPTLADSGPAAVCDRIAGEIRALAGAARGNVIGVGIGSPGFVDCDGVIRNAINLGWTEMPLAREIARRLDGLPVFVENDANANAIGEGHFGSARGCQHYILLTIGSGLGCGVVSHGRIISGAGAMAANLGHYSVEPENGLACICGNRGCAETIASGPGLVALTQSNRTPQEIIRAARAGELSALAAVTKMARVIGEIAAVAAAVIDPQVLIIGGGLGFAAFDLLQTGIADEMSRRLPPPQKVPAIRVATLGSPAVGAASLVWERTTKMRAANLERDCDSSRATTSC